MRKTMRSLALAGGFALVAGLTAAAAATGGAEVHHMTIKQPDGGTIEVTYTGKIAPKVTFAQGPFMPTQFAPDPGFGMLQRISADMDRQLRAMQAMFANDFATLGNVPELDDATLKSMPAG